MKNQSLAVMAFIASVALAPAWTSAANTKAHDDQQKQLAYFNDQLLAVTLKAQNPKPPKSGESDLNSFYTSDDLVNGQHFVGVIGLRPDDDFKDRARKVEIHFTRSQAAYQLTSEKAIKQAVQRGDITLKVTDQIFRWEFDDE